ncbi:variant leucine-rich repeat-containing protein [Actinomyces minihominis]|uniref:variant leucine-rich repeat-containing protein n=1 Tax=Actinomyces minihominis TaxID=2002838 RepID=UPI00101AE0A2|nr:hypothetical protein [Actinomyces minihominis]
MENLEAEASNPRTAPVRLQELANNYPRLRPLIAMNPTAYPGLVQWLADLNDPAINVALAQRGAANNASASGPRRVSVMGREDTDPTPLPVPAVTQQVRFEPVGTQTGQLQQVSGPSTSNRKPLMVGLALTFVALLFVGFALLFGGRGTETGDNLVAESGPQSSVSSVGEDASGEDSAPDEDGTAAPADEGAETEAEKVVRFPAASDALNVSHFVSPSGNIACRIAPEAAECTLNAFAFADANLANCGAGPLTIRATEFSSELDCSAPQISASGATTLAYGDSAASDDYACTSSEFGVACWNTISGAGFGISRGGYQNSLTGPVDPAQFPWN